MWRYKYDSFNYCSIKQDKINLILAVSKNNKVHYEFVKKNKVTNIFKNFMECMIKKLSEEEIKKYVFFFDNTRFHKTKELKNFYKNNKLKIITNVPYENSFDSVELYFRYIKNVIYKNIYNYIDDVIKEVINILNSYKFRRSLLLQYKEAIEKYIYFENK